MISTTLLPSPGPPPPWLAVSAIFILRHHVLLQGGVRFQTLMAIPTRQSPPWVMAYFDVLYSLGAPTAAQHGAWVVVVFNGLTSGTVT